MRMAIVLGLALALSAQAQCCPNRALREITRHPLTWMVSPVGLAVPWLRPGVPVEASSQQTAFNAARHAITSRKRGGWRWGVKKQGNGYPYGRATADCGNLRA